MTSAAALGVDTCPMEEIDMPAYDELLGLKDTRYATLCACAVGYRSADDKYGRAQGPLPARPDHRAPLSNGRSPSRHLASFCSNASRRWPGSSTASGTDSAANGGSSCGRTLRRNI